MSQLTRQHLRHEKVIGLTGRLTKMIQPYLGRREYGGLRILPVSLNISPGTLPNYVSERKISWVLDYERIFGSSSVIRASFLITEANFEYPRHPDRQEIRTEDVVDVINNYYRVRLEYIQPQRREDLMTSARLSLERGISIESAIENIEEFAQIGHPHGPTGEEVELYRQFILKI